MQIQDQGSFTRGSQLYAHKFRMLLKGSKYTVLVGVITATAWLLFRAVNQLTFATVYYYLIERYVQLKLDIGRHFYEIPEIGISFYSLEQHKFIYRIATEYLHRFYYSTSHGSSINSFIDWLLYKAGIEFLIAFLVGVTTTILFFIALGSRIIGTKKLRGAELVEPEELARILYKAGRASDLKISGVPLVKSSENRHILLTGTTGSGKTNMLNSLLPQIRQRGDKAIIFDLTGVFENRFYQSKLDTILNPFDSRTALWLPWNDCHYEYDYASLASSFISTNSMHDKYWDEAASKVFSCALYKHQDSKSLKSLLDLLCNASFNEFCDYFKGTTVAGLVSKENEKGTASVRSTFLNKIEGLKYLKEGGSFSIKDWVNNGTGWLFITAPPSQREALRPLISAWIDIAIQGLKERSPEVMNSNLWFILDELPALQKIPSLTSGLAEGRKYGGCFVAGLQNIHQLEEIYGHSGAFSLLDQFNTRLFFKVGDAKTAEYASKNLGEKQISETKEHLSYGADSLRDGVNINSSKYMEPLVIYTEVMQLEPRSCYLKLDGPYPITKLTMKVQNN